MFAGINLIHVELHCCYILKFSIENGNSFEIHRISRSHFFFIHQRMFNIKHISMRWVRFQLKYQQNIECSKHCLLLASTHKNTEPVMPMRIFFSHLIRLQFVYVIHNVPERNPMEMGKKKLECYSNVFGKKKKLKSLTLSIFHLICLKRNWHAEPKKNRASSHSFTVLRRKNVSL